MKGYIYKYFNHITNKVYIGQTVDLVSRKGAHKYKSEFVVNKFYNAVRKYGWDTFEFSIVTEIEAPNEELCTIALDYLETLYIKSYNSFLNGYNSTPGGHSARGMKRSEEYKNYCRNRTYSEETRNKMSIAAKNRIVSEKTREKYRKNAIDRNFSKYRELTVEKRNAAIKRALAKPIIQLDTDNKIINEFDSISDAKLFVKNNLAPHLSLRGIEKALIRHCKGETKKIIYYGFIWKYKTDV